MNPKFIPVAAVFFVISACASPPKNAELVTGVNDLRTIEEIYNDQLKQIKIGMTPDDVAQIIPSLLLAGKSEDLMALSLTHTQKYVTNSDITRQNVLWGAGSPNPHTHRQSLWFYFKDGLLVKWGQPENWPD